MENEQSNIAENWYHVSFDALYPMLYAHRTVQAAHPEVMFSIEHAPIRPSDCVLDLCCGEGRHMVHLIGHSRRVVGLDYSPDLLGPARRKLGGDALLVRGDMRALPFDAVFDVVANYFTSFGYFRSEEENLAVVKGMARALKPGGRFLIDYINLAHTQANLNPQTVRHHDAFEIRETRWIDGEAPRINKTTTVWRDGEKIGEKGESVQLYTPDEFDDLLHRGGLRVEHLYGDYTGAQCSASRPRMIAVGGRA